MVSTPSLGSGSTVSLSNGIRIAGCHRAVTKRAGMEEAACIRVKNTTEAIASSSPTSTRSKLQKDNDQMRKNNFVDSSSLYLWYQLVS